MKIRSIIPLLILLSVHFYTIIDASSWGNSDAVILHYIISLVFIAVGSGCAVFTEKKSLRVFRKYCITLIIASAVSAFFRVTKTLPYTLYEISHLYILPPFYGFRALGIWAESLVSLAISAVWLAVIRFRSQKEVYV